MPGRTGTGPRQGASGSNPGFSSAPSWSGTSPRWRLLHNGYPVVLLAENTDLDISALARSGLETGAPDLRTVLPCAERLTPRPKKFRPILPVKACPPRQGHRGQRCTSAAVVPGSIG